MNVKQYMVIKGIRQVEVVRELGASPATVNLYLNGWRRLPPQYLRSLARILKLSIQEVDQNRVDGAKAGDQ